MFNSLFFIIFFFVFLIVLVTAGLAGLKAAPYVPTRRKDIKRMLELGGIKAEDTVYDLGSGDGRLVDFISLRYRARVIGFEISLLPYLFSKIRFLFSSGKDRAKIVYKDFFKQDFSNASVVVCFLTPMAMRRLKEKFERELPVGARVISYAFRIKGWPPRKISKPGSKDTPIFLYVKK